jgi:hypothetical protein
MIGRKYPKRWLRFSLRTLMAGTALLSIGLFLLLHVVVERRSERTRIERLGGTIEVFTKPKPIEIAPGIEYHSYQRTLGPDVEPEIPQWRRWLGDQAFNQIYLPTGATPDEVQRVQHVFPEAKVDVAPANEPGAGFF